MSSRDTIAGQTQPQRRIVVYEPSASPQDGLGSRLDGTDASTAIRTVSDPLACVAALSDSTVDGLVCRYGPETTAATEALYELLSTAVPQLPRIAYLESAEELARAHELGFTAVHLRRETDDTAVLEERLRAALEASATDPADRLQHRLVAATVDGTGTLRRTAGDGIGVDGDERLPLWELSWTPSRTTVEDAIERAMADPGEPYSVGTTADILIFVADSTPSARTNGGSKIDRNGGSKVDQNDGLSVGRNSGSSVGRNGGSTAGSHRLTILTTRRPDTAAVDGEQHTDAAIISLDTDWTISDVNDRAEALLDVSESALLGQPMETVFPQRRGGVDWHSRFDEAVETDSSTSFIVESGTADRWFEVTVYPSASGLSVSFQNSTDRKRRTVDLERYERILETVSDGVYALDADGVFTYVNEGLAELTGYSRSELVGSHVSTFKSESTVERAEAAVGEQIDRARAGETPRDLSLDLEIETADGRTVPCVDHIALLPFDDWFRGSVGTLRDVSARKQREQTLSGLLTVTRTLLTAESTGRVASLVVEAVSDVLGYDRAVVHLATEDSDYLFPEAATDVVAEEVDTFSTPVAGEGPVGSAFESGSAERFDPADAAGGGYGDSAELIAVPLGSYGTLTVGAHDSNTFKESDCQPIQLLTANAEEALNRTQRRQALRRYEMILESVQEMMCVVDAAGRIKLLTDPLASRLDADRSELIGRGFSTILTESTDGPNGPLSDLFGNGSVDGVTFKDSMRSGEGETVPISVEASQLPPVDGQPEAVITIHDISDLVSAKEAAAAERERFTYLFENLTDPVDEIRVDEPTVKGVNSAFRSQFGEPADIEATSSGEEPAVTPIALDDERIVDREGQQPLSEEFRSEVEDELKLNTTEGTKYFLYRSVPYELDAETGGFEIYTDITALKQREIQLQVLHR
ncbi:MAG: PAS domain S-box protein, partial [Halohasta sp.]